MVNNLKECVKKKIYRNDYYEDFNNACNYYKKKHQNNYRLFSLKMIAWVYHSLFRKYNPDVKKSGEGKSSKQHSKSWIPPLSTFNVGVFLNGEIEDYIMAANYIYAFYSKCGISLMYIDLYFSENEETVNSFFVFPFIREKIMMDKDTFCSLEIQKKYDLFMDIKRYASIMNIKNARINEMCPMLFDFILNTQKFEMLNNRFKQSPEMYGQMNYMSLLEGKNRVQQMDINRYLDLQSDLDFPVKYSIDENNYLHELGLLKNKYILISNDAISNNGSFFNNKTWIKIYYKKLIKELRKKYIDYAFVELGVESNLDMDWFDIMLSDALSPEPTTI